ncbi:hypothetical protein H114_25449 [Streptomyces gancidicus BKS 13-15]|uniref:Uncharacterized protein n=1 Tax=Streptomyces gancidicus BKS 13-15 TaxID=1284664 RepID=M3CPU2_STREZ|nr:hypothetical protein H114_25449 [Streptomyces gancidicus BKS 13-15]
MRSGSGASSDVSEDTSPAPAEGASATPASGASAALASGAHTALAEDVAGPSRGTGTRNGTWGAGPRSLAVTTAKDAHSPSGCPGTVWPFARHSATSSA